MFCEFPGDAKGDHDSVPDKRCPDIGFIPATGINMCVLHREPLGYTKDGWLTCCKSCVTPWVPKSRRGSDAK